MTPAEALADVRGYAAAGRFRLTRHARQRCEERGATFGDVGHALANARTCSAGEPDRWRVEGPDREGDSLTLVVAIEAGVVVVTVF